MSLPQGIVVAMSFMMFPPILFIITPILYSQSIKKLTIILNDYD